MPVERPWLAHYAPEVPADAVIPDCSIVDLFRDAATIEPDRVAFDFLGATTTYGDAWEQILRAAAALHALGIRKGDRVALALPNCPQHVIAFYAVLRLGAIVVEHNPLYTEIELSRQFADHEPALVIAWDCIAPMAARAAHGAPVIAVNITEDLPRHSQLLLRLPIAKARATRAAMTSAAPGLATWHEVTRDVSPIGADVEGPTPQDIALLQYTGGTTGVPKGAMLTHRNLVANAAQSIAWVPMLHAGEETVYAVLPLFHVYGLTLCLMAAIQLRMTVVLFPKFDPDLVMKAWRRRPCTFLPGVPPMYPRLVEAAKRHNVPLRSVKVALAGAMALQPDIVELWEAASGGLLIEGYGMTESSPITVGNPVSSERRVGCIGIPYPNTEVRVADPEHPFTDVQQGQAGELLVRGPQVFSGYWNRGEETAATLLPEGWLRTGDIVVQDDDGFLRIVDRIKELILVGGFNVYPSEVETAIRALPGVADCAVTSIPEGDHDIVVAAVVATDGAVLDPEELRAACRSSLAAYKVPRQVHIVQELPRSVVGKVLRRQVRDQLMQG